MSTITFLGGFMGAIGAAALLAGCTSAPAGDGSDVQASEQNATRSGPVRVGLFAGGGAMEPYIGNVSNVVGSDSRFSVKRFWDGSVNFRDFDVVVFPGGLGSTEWETLQWQGQQNLKTFVSEGGGFIGICAGYYLALDNGFITADYAGHWERGGGSIKVDIAQGNAVLSGGGTHSFDYLNGPVIWPTSNVKVLATFAGHIGGAETMIGKPAVVTATYQRGRVVGFSPHPENSGLGHLLTDALAWAAGKSSSTQPDTGGGGGACASATLGRTAAKNTCVKRTDDNTWYRCRGNDEQDWVSLDWPTPALCTSCPQWGPACPY